MTNTLARHRPAGTGLGPQPHGESARDLLRYSIMALSVLSAASLVLGDLRAAATPRGTHRPHRRRRAGRHRRCCVAGPVGWVGTAVHRRLDLPALEPSGPGVVRRRGGNEGHGGPPAVAPRRPRVRASDWSALRWTALRRATHRRTAAERGPPTGPRRDVDGRLPAPEPPRPATTTATAATSATMPVRAELTTSCAGQARSVLSRSSASSSTSSRLQKAQRTKGFPASGSS